MEGFSAIFSSYFFKHFPQWQGKVTRTQQESLRTFAQSITSQKECQSIWDGLEKNLFLLQAFYSEVHRFLSGEKKQGMCQEWILLLLTLGLMFCFGVILFKKTLSQEAIKIATYVIDHVFQILLKYMTQH